MQLVLLVPGMLALDAGRLDAMRSLGQLARYAEAPRVEPQGIAAALFALLGLAPDTPVAPLSLLGADGDPRDDYVLCADPVQLAADRDTVVIVQRIDDLTADEQAQLVQTLDGHFADDGLRFEAPRPDAWFARVANGSQVRMTPLDAALRRPLFPQLPAGPDARRWRGVQNEIQMLLHENPVNVAREAHARPAVTGVWFWGGGRMRDVAPIAITSVAATQGIAGDLPRGIARHAGVPAAPLGATDRFERIFAAARAAPSRHATRAFVLAALPAGLAPDALEAAWLAPALARLAHRDVEAVHLIADGHGFAATWSAGPPTWWRRIAARAGGRRFDVPRAA